jgi:hypothetical protein
MRGYTVNKKALSDDNVVAHNKQTFWRSVVSLGVASLSLLLPSAVYAGDISGTILKIQINTDLKMLYFEIKPNDGQDVPSLCKGAKPNQFAMDVSSPIGQNVLAFLLAARASSTNVSVQHGACINSFETPGQVASPSLLK